MLWTDTLKDYIGESFTIKDQTFIFSRSYEMAGLLAIWESEKYAIYAHPNFDGIGVPVDVWYNGESIGDDYFAPSVNSFDEYKAKVKEIAERILKER